jgi:hypothetical protein
MAQYARKARGASIEEFQPGRVKKLLRWLKKDTAEARLAVG